MFIKEIVIEGFKSYASRTVISAFDPQFNAITGLNGSGKSNILDSILFLLGLSQFSMVRVNNLQELVYKQGHAGVTKATVTIEFDNSNKDQSPNGYDNQSSLIVTRQISNGKSKYFLNGHTESNNRIKSMFKSIQLNIDNPHFLVAQGRITKILSLKPEGLLLMLEETAGTSFFIEKKNESLRIIQKKEEKVKQINTLIETEISPKMEKIRKEREQFIQFKRIEGEIEKVSKTLKAYEYFQKSKEITERTEEKSDLKAVLPTLQTKIEEARVRFRIVEEEFSATVKEKSNENSELEDEYNGVVAELSKAQAKLAASESSLNLKENDYKSLMDMKRGSEEQISLLEKRKEDRASAIARLNEEIKVKKQLLEEIKGNIQAIEKGELNAGRDAMAHQEKVLNQNVASLISEIRFYEEKMMEDKSKLTVISL